MRSRTQHAIATRCRSREPAGAPVRSVKMKHLLAALPAAVLASCSPADPAPPEAEQTQAGTVPAVTPASDRPDDQARYTSLAGCRLLRSNAEEAGFYEHECPGEGGYRLRTSESDLREGVVVLAPGGGEHDLGLVALANGAFSSLGDTVEWRGDMAGGGFAPDALILRQSVMEDPDPAVPETSYLVVARLRPTPCVVARIAPGPRQNERAREAADGGEVCIGSAS